MLLKFFEIKSELNTFKRISLIPIGYLIWRSITRGEQAIFNLEIKKKSGSSLNPDIHNSKVPSSDIFS